MIADVIMAKCSHWYLMKDGQWKHESNYDCPYKDELPVRDINLKEKLK